VIAILSILNAWRDKQVMVDSFPDFVLLKWNTVALWAVEMEQDICGICKYVCF
jgi:hypothetical protein